MHRNEWFSRCSKSSLICQCDRHIDILISVKDEETSFKHLGEQGLQAILPTVSNLMHIAINGNEKIAHSSQNNKLTIKDCERAAKYIVVMM